jgi:hypothetical protein
MRITAGNKELLDKVFYTVDKYRQRAILISMEVNSNNLT